MEVTLETIPGAKNAATTAEMPRTNGWSEEQLRKMLDAAGRRKDDTQYLELWEKGVAEYRRQVQAEAEHELELAQEETK